RSRAPPPRWSLFLSPPTTSLAFQRRLPVYRWWARMNAVHWSEDYPEFADWFISRCFPEPHSTKSIDDGVGWALDTDPGTLIATAGGKIHRKRRVLRELAHKLDFPVLVVQGKHDRIAPPRDGRALARLGEGQL